MSTNSWKRIDEELHWSKHNLEVAYIWDNIFGRNFVKVQVSDSRLFINYMHGGDVMSYSVQQNSNGNNNKREYDVIMLNKVSHLEELSVNNAEYDVPLRETYSKLLRLFYKLDLDGRGADKNYSELYFPEKSAISRQISDSWTYVQLRYCLGLTSMLRNFHDSSAKLYYDDTLSCLHTLLNNKTNNSNYKSHSVVEKWLYRHEQYRVRKSVEAGEAEKSVACSIDFSNKHHNDELDDSLKSILDEFAEACLLDLGIKDEAFRSREIFILMQTIIYKQLCDIVQLPKTVDEELDTNTKTNGHTNPHSDYNDLQNKLRKIIVDRLLIIHGALKVVSSLLFSSQCIRNRIGIVIGMNPLSFSSWFAYLVPDLFAILAENIGYVETEDDWGVLIGAKDKSIRRIVTAQRAEQEKERTFHSSVNSRLSHDYANDASTSQLDRGEQLHKFSHPHLASMTPKYVENLSRSVNSDAAMSTLVVNPLGDSDSGSVADNSYFLGTPTLHIDTEECNVEHQNHLLGIADYFVNDLDENVCQEDQLNSSLNNGIDNLPRLRNGMCTPSRNNSNYFRCHTSGAQTPNTGRSLKQFPSTSSLYGSEGAVHSPMGGSKGHGNVSRSMSFSLTPRKSTAQKLHTLLATPMNVPPRTNSKSNLTHANTSTLKKHKRVDHANAGKKDAKQSSTGSRLDEKLRQYMSNGLSSSNYGIDGDSPHDIEYDLVVVLLGQVRQSIVDEQSLITFELCGLYGTEAAVILNTDIKTGNTGSFLENHKQLAFLPEKRKENYEGKRVLMERKNLPLIPSTDMQMNVRDVARIDAGINDNHTYLTRTGPLAGTVLSIVPGELFTNTLYWNDCIEDTVIRISTLLDDWLTAHLMGIEELEVDPEDSDEKKHMSNTNNNAAVNLDGYDSNLTCNILSAAPSPVRKPRSGLGFGHLRNRDMERDSPSIQSNIPFAASDDSSRNHIHTTPLLYSKKLLLKKQEEDQNCNREHERNGNTLSPPPYPFKRSPLITQEIMLFTSSMLLKYLSLDSSKVRGVLSNELLTYWENIMYVLNIICPRPDTVACTIPSNLNRANNNDSHRESNYSNQSSFLSKFSKCFVSNKENEKKNEEDFQSGHENERKNAIPNVNDYKLWDENVFDTKLITLDTWMLILMTRVNVEETIILLGLENTINLNTKEHYRGNTRFEKPRKDRSDWRNKNDSPNSTHHFKNAYDMHNYDGETHVKLKNRDMHCISINEVDEEHDGEWDERNRGSDMSTKPVITSAISNRNKSSYSTIRGNTNRSRK